MTALGEYVILPIMFLALFCAMGLFLFVLGWGAWSFWDSRRGR